MCRNGISQVICTVDIFLASCSFADGLELLRGGESLCSAACSALWSGSGEAEPRKCLRIQAAAGA